MKEAMKAHKSALRNLYNAASVTNKTEAATQSYLRAKVHFHKAEQNLILKMNGVTK